MVGPMFWEVFLVSTSLVNMMWIIYVQLGAEALAKLFVISRRAILEWPRLPSISCDMVARGEPDIAGPGVIPNR